MEINFQAQKTSAKMISLVAYVHFGYSNVIKVTEQFRNFTTAFVAGGEQKYGDTFPYVTEKKKPAPARVSTGITLPATFWEQKAQKTTGSYSNLNDELKTFKENVGKLYEALKKSQIEITPRYFQKEIKKHIINNKYDDVIHPAQPFKKPEPTFADTIIKQVSNGVSFPAFMLSEIERERKLTVIPGSTKEKSLMRYETSAKRMQEFETYLAKKYKDEDFKLYCNELTEELFSQYFIFLQTQSEYAKENKVGYSHESINTEKVSVKKYLFLACKNKLTVLTREEIEDCKILSKTKVPEKEIVYLSIDELDKMIAVTDFECMDNKAEQVRDIFTYVCFTGGKRISDYKNTFIKPHPSNIGQFYVDNTSIKSGVYSKLPAFKRVVRIWNKYNGKMPKLPNDFNTKLRQVARKAGIAEEKIKSITSHCARKSFCSNMVYEFEIPANIVMMYSGHKSYAEFSKYIGKDVHNAYELLLTKIKERDE
jgi:integrase